MEEPTMADPTRYRGERGRGFGDDRYGQRGRDQGSDGGYIAQRGFGNARSGYGPEERGRGDHDRGGRAERGGGDWGYPREDRGRYGARAAAGSFVAATRGGFRARPAAGLQPAGCRRLWLGPGNRG